MVPIIVANLLFFFLVRRVYITRGPNDVWHCDGYDKMKPFGFPIHGAVDGFSRKVLWLTVVKSNNNPVVPAALYLRAVKEFGVCPIPLKTDCGSKNADMAGLQCHLTATWWSHFGRSFSGWAIDHFKELVHDGKFIPDNMFHMDCIWFVYAQFIQTQ